MVGFISKNISLKLAESSSDEVQESYESIENTEEEVSNYEEEESEFEWALKIPKINLYAEISEGTDTETLNQYIGHFEDSKKENRKCLFSCS